MRLPRIGAALRSFGGERARANAGSALASTAAARAAVEELAARLAMKESRSS